MGKWANDKNKNIQQKTQIVNKYKKHVKPY